jgi:acetyltransferase
MKQQASCGPVEHWELSDGKVAMLRSIGPQDAEIEQAFVRGLSEESKYFRFMTQVCELSPEMLQHFINPDPMREAALIVTVPRDGGCAEEEIAVGRYAMNPGNESCEFAIVVADAWQAHGIATRLMQALMKHAAGRGIKRMEGFVMASNAKMLEFMRFLGFEVRSSAKGPQIKVVSRPLDDMATI